MIYNVNTYLIDTPTHCGSYGRVINDVT